ncbi:DAK2 domain-containing protein [Micromonospora cathayae]|uniref:DAK2 domain-containing protein n=1 Tax=Micromonospora cathayae TaxID=3028804 RepID=A0ABY7ZWI0_9ACTN|nr:DAK2 domain-containing protein [Micromonospora sp. HUAS 3]WDZ87410.1 DAK2 domain-containing protein [Micromonospora sp. HUAS 3]
MLETLDADAVRRWCASGLDALRRHQGEIDDLNVYPVPDGDTGTNLVLTLTSAQQALAMDLDTSPEGGGAAVTPHGHALRLMARGALLGARGNSGVILAQLLRGLADALTTVPTVRGRELAGALRGAATAAYGAVAHPVEGTLLSVAAAAATGAEQADSDDLRAVVRSAAGAATRALARTPQQLATLARAGVVDAGGQGLCLLLDALVEVVAGEPPDRPATVPRPVRPPVTAVRETGSEAYAYEVQYLLDAAPEAVTRLRATLDALGDSLVVVGDAATGQESSTWNVHVHVNDVGAAVEAGVVAGRPYLISVTRFADQPAVAQRPGPDDSDRAVATRWPGPDDSDRAAATRWSGADGADRAAVVVASGAGLAALLSGEGATVLAGSPSTGELLDAVRATGAARVVVLPTDPATRAVAGTVAHQAQPLGVKVSVVPTRSPVQALAALAVRDPQRSFEDDVIAMAEAAGACRSAEVCHAGREALTVAGPCRPGDVLALVEGEVHLVGADLLDTCTALLDRMLGGGGELVTLLAGADAPAGLTDAVRAHVARHWPFVEVQAYAGGQPHYPLLVGVE